MLYESLLAFAVAFFAALPFLAIAADAQSGFVRLLFQFYLFLVLGAYFVASWRRGGQTLAMKTWKLRVRGANGAPLTLKQAMLRYLYAWPCLLLAGAGVVYAAFDRERQFLHDRLAGTKIVATE